MAKKSKKEQFEQSTIFDQMRLNAQDLVDAAQREYNSATQDLEECSNHTKKMDYKEDVDTARDDLNAARNNYSRIINEIKDFEK